MEDPDTAIPTDLPADGSERPTTLVCPDCAGNLVVRRKGRHGLLFRCRIGHVYATPELLAGKERRLEAHLWSAVGALDELAALLRDLDRDPERRLRAERHAARIRQIIEESTVLRLDDLGPCTDPEEEQGP